MIELLPGELYAPDYEPPLEDEDEEDFDESLARTVGPSKKRNAVLPEMRRKGTSPGSSSSIEKALPVFDVR